MKLRLKDDRGEFTVDVPMSCYEIPYRKFIEARGIEVDSFLGIREFVDHFCSGEVDRLDPATDKKPTGLIKPGQDIGLLDVYFHIVEVIEQYAPEEIAIDTEQRRRIEVYLKQVKLTTGEVVELMEMERLAELERSEEDLALNANIDFNLGLGEYALLVRPPGERLPCDRGELDAYIERRKAEVADVSLADVLAVRFFFLNTLLESKLTNAINSFSEAYPNLGWAKRVVFNYRRKRLEKAYRKLLDSMLTGN